MRRSPSIRFVMGVAAIAALPLRLHATAPAQQIVDRVVATVGSALITLSDVRAVRALRLFGASSDAGDEEIVTLLVDHELMRVEVERFGAPQGDAAAVEARVAAVAAAFADEPTFRATLAAHGMTEARLRALLHDELRRERYLESRFSAAAIPTDEDVRRHFQDRPQQYTVGGEVLLFQDVEALVRAEVTELRRARLIGQWLEGLRRRADIRRPPLPAALPPPAP
jgi:hypothetical protein